MTATLIVGGELTNDVTSSVKKAPATDTPADKAVTSGADKAATTTADDDLPEDQVPQRLRGHKTFKEAVVKYRELEAELGRKNNEVGQLRYTVDEMLRLKTLSDGGTVATAKHTPVTTDALLTNPEEAIASVVKRANAEGNGAQSDRLAKLEFEAAKREFTGKHPTYETDMADATFIDWVKASPFRTKLAQATVNGSFDAADELFSLYGEIKEAKKPNTEAAKAAAANASLTRPGNGGASSGAKKGAPPSAGSKDIFSKTELRKLYMNDRDKYNAMGPEIQRAYAEGRVK